MAVCKKMDSFLILEPSERMAVMKSFADDHSGGIANKFLLMDIDERNEYIGSVVSSLWIYLIMDCLTEEECKRLSI